MGEYKEQKRQLTVTTPLGDDVLLLQGFSGREAISQLFSFQIDLLATLEDKPKVKFDSMLGQPITIHVELPGDKKRHINGLCIQMADTREDQTFHEYRVQIVPKVWLLTRKAQSRIFQQKSVPDILKEVFKGFDVQLHLQGTFEQRDYCVQYRETDFNFACRLMEEEGIFYFFKHSDGSHQMVIANDSGSHQPVPDGPTSLIYEELKGGTRDEDRIYAWEKIQEVRSGKVTLWDHCFEKPPDNLESQQKILDSVQVGTVTHKLGLSINKDLELYDFPGEYAQRFDGVTPGGGDRASDISKIRPDGMRTAELRIEEEAVPGLQILGASHFRHISSGFKFTLERHPNANGDYVVTSVQHSGRESDFRTGGTGAVYQNTFTCIPFALPFRARRVSPKPVIQGSQTAVVVGPAGEEIFTDKYGRVKVQFFWDRQGKKNESSCCWIRVGQLMAGRRWGSSFWPRIGQEVIVDFLEGDPDQPIIIGSVYNADQMPPYLGQGPDPKHKNDNKVSGIKTNSTKGGVGYNELRFDDTKDKEQIFVHAERNLDTRVKNDEMHTVGHDRFITVGGEKDGKCVGDEKRLIYQDRHIHVRRNHIEKIDKSMQLTVGSLDLSVGGGEKHSVGKDLELKVGGAFKTQVAGKYSLKAGSVHSTAGSYGIGADQEVHIKAGMKLILEAGAQVTLKGPGGFVDIGPAGVTIQGTMVLINSGGAAGSGSGASPDAPADAAAANPDKPAVADDAKTGQKSS